jgi:hypothetical protein
VEGIVKSKFNRNLILALVAILMLVGISVLSRTPSASPQAPQAIQRTAATRQRSTPTAATIDCQLAGKALLTSIATGLTVSGGGDLIQGWTVRSTDHQNAYYVAAQITGPGISSPIAGIWATNRLDGTGLILSVDAFAKEFSDWADGGLTDAALSIADEGADRVRQCARKSMR